MNAPKIHFNAVLGNATTDKRLDVLRCIHASGSISEAARTSGVSYKAAWQALETLSNLAGVPVVAKVVGGSGGGGARLTPEGLQVLQAAELMQAARAQALAQIADLSLDAGVNARGIYGVGLRTSMRNQLPSTIKEITKSRGAARIVLCLADDQQISARITLESLQLLALDVGQQVLAMCKATSITVAPKIVAMRGVNLLHGTVARRAGGASGIEVSLALARGSSLVGFADLESHLKLRQPAMAAVEENAVVIGVAG